MENPIKIDDLGVPLFLETPISRIIYTNPLEDTIPHRDLEIQISAFTGHDGCSNQPIGKEQGAMVQSCADELMLEGLKKDRRGKIFLPYNIIVS